MRTTEREAIIKNYIDGYNQFDVAKMIHDLDADIIFENIQHGETSMMLVGCDAFREQAEEAKKFFKTRKQTINFIRHTDDTTEIEISYSAVVALDLPNGFKNGQLLELTGKSIFEFSDNKITRITDIS